MTSIEFASRYRLLKNVATRGARSFLAQQVELGRMVMVHYLDAEDVEERATTLRRLEALRPPARDKLLEITEVDGTPVAVTLFISSFKDFATWLDSVGAPAVIPRQPSVAAVTAPPLAPTAPLSQPGEFTRAFNKLEPAVSPVIPAPPPEPARKQEPPKRTPGEFTRIFGKLDEVTLDAAPEPSVSSTAASSEQEESIPTVIMEAVKAPQPKAPEAVKLAPPPPPAPAESSPSFTAIFGSLHAAAPAPTELPATAPLAAPAPKLAPVMPPQPPAVDLRPAAPSPVPQPPSSQPGEFTQLFQRLSPTGGTPPSASLGSAPFLSPDVPRPLEPTPRADFAPPAPPVTPVMPATSPAVPLGIPSLPPPALGAAIGAPPSASAPKLPDLAPPVPNGSMLPTVPPVVPPAPAGAGAPPRAWGAAAPPAIGASVFGNSGPSEFTRILSPIAAPPPPPVSIEPPTSPSQAAGGSGGGSKTKSMLPLIIGLAVVVVLTIVIVVYFGLRK